MGELPSLCLGRAVKNNTSRLVAICRIWVTHLAWALSQASCVEFDNLFLSIIGTQFKFAVPYKSIPEHRIATLHLVLVSFWIFKSSISSSESERSKVAFIFDVSEGFCGILVGERGIPQKGERSDSQIRKTKESGTRWDYCWFRMWSDAFISYGMRDKCIQRRLELLKRWDDLGCKALCTAQEAGSRTVCESIWVKGRFKNALLGSTNDLRKLCLDSYFDFLKNITAALRAPILGGNFAVWADLSALFQWHYRHSPSENLRVWRRDAISQHRTALRVEPSPVLTALCSTSGNLLLFWLLFAVHPEVGDVFFLIQNHEALVLQFDFYCHDLWYCMIPISLEQSPFQSISHIWKARRSLECNCIGLPHWWVLQNLNLQTLRFGNGGTWGTWGTGTRCKRWLESSEPQRCDWLAQTRLLASLPFLLFAYLVCFCKRTSKKVWRYGLYGICWIHKQFCHIRRFRVAFVCRIAESWRFDSRIWSQESDGFLSAAFKRRSSRETARWCAPCDHWRRSRTPDEAIKEEEGTSRDASQSISWHLCYSKTRKSCERMWNTVARNNYWRYVC